MADALYRILTRHGVGQLWAHTIVHGVVVVVIVLVAVAGGRAVTRAAQRSVRAFTQRSPLAESSRAVQRATTLSGVVASAIRVAVGTVACLLVLDEIGFNVGPLLAGASIVGIAIAFGAQSLVKDFLTGFFILAEDQYGVGDVVSVEGVTGTVEEVNLRLTRLRAPDGTVWFIPNGEIRKVGNSCKEWSRAVVDVVVPVGADVAAATAALREEAAAVRADPDWATVVLEDPDVLGVESLSVDGVTLRVTAKTTPQQQHRVARELRARISARLRDQARSVTEQPADHP